MTDDMPRTPTDYALDDARAVLRQIDRRGESAALYVSVNEDPMGALVKIRRYLVQCIDRDKAVALAVVNLDRVIDALRTPPREWRGQR